MTLADFGSAVSVTAALAVVVTAVIYQRQLAAMTKARQLDSLIIILKYLEDLSLRRARYFMFEHGNELRDLFDVPFSWEARREFDRRVRELSGNDLNIHDIDLALNALNNVCFLVRQGYAPPEVVDAFMKNSLLHAWHAFEPYAHHRRRRPDNIGEPSQYAAHLEWVVRHMCGKKDQAQVTTTEEHMSRKPVGSGYFALAFGIIFTIGLIASFRINLAKVNPQFFIHLWLAFAAATLIGWGFNRVKNGNPGDHRVGQDTINFVVALVGTTIALLELFRSS